MSAALPTAVQITIAVRLIIPDTAAITARRALTRAGLATLDGLAREVCWTVTSRELSAEACAQRLMNVDVIVNRNKHRARWWLGALEQAPLLPGERDGQRTALLLVESYEAAEVPWLQHILSERLRLAGVNVERQATLWHVRALAGTSASEVAMQAASALLANPHAQRASLFGEVLASMGGANSSN